MHPLVDGALRRRGVSRRERERETRQCCENENMVCAARLETVALLRQYVGQQKPKATMAMWTILKYLEAKAAGDELEPERSQTKLKPIRREDVPMSVLAKVIAELAGEMPPEDQVLLSFIAKLKIELGAE